VIVVGIGSFVLVLAVAYLVGRPFLLTDGDRQDTAQLREDRRRVIAQLRDLDMEFATEKLAEDEYRTQRAARIAELDASETALTELEETVAGEPGVDAPASIDAAIEARIAARRRALERAECPGCGDEVGADDHFCRSCGAELTGVETR
jgi:hypothetical protein